MIRKLNKLPKEIISKIISYTYSPQSKELCDDIKSYHLTMINIHNYYINTLFIDICQIDSCMFKDILSFLNSDTPTLNGHQKLFKHIIRRFILYANKSPRKIDIIVFKNMINSNYRISKILIGLMNTIERERLMTFLMYI